MTATTFQTVNLTRQDGHVGVRFVPTKNGRVTWFSQNLISGEMKVTEDHMTYEEVFFLISTLRDSGWR